MSKVRLLGYLISAAGTALWLYGYFTTGSAPLVDWSANAPRWIAMCLPNRESEVGMALMLAANIPMYWPSKR
jgi:hypothetical protein